MNILLLGAGGREHALAWKIAQSPLLTRLFCAPGNPGTAVHGSTVAIPLHDVAALVAFAQREQIDLVVVGPDNPLAEGIVDHFAAAGILAFGPTAAAARIESSKAFAKAVMRSAGVPTAETHVFTDPAAATAFVQQRGQPWVVKADGLALGKGVIVADTPAETLAAIVQLAATPAGTSLLLEERLEGREVSVLALCDGERLLALPPARDHKRLGEGDTGPNTGGMGVVAPVDDVSPELHAQIVATCMQPVVATLAAQGTPFRGVLYAGIMLTAQGPQVLEFNARFGDPEAQALLPLLEGDLLAALYACATGTLSPDMLRVLPGYAACVVLAAANYPGTPRTGDPISGLDQLDPAYVHAFHAGTRMDGATLVTAGGRVLGLTGIGATLDSARANAYAAAAQVNFAGKHYRRDIGGLIGG
jgi:phosphoribosylamine--glycine ligase